MQFTNVLNAVRPLCIFILRRYIVETSSKRKRKKPTLDGEIVKAIHTY